MAASGLDADEVLGRLDPNDLAAPMSAEFLAWLAGRLETRAGVLDLVLVAPQPVPDEDLPALVPREDLVGGPADEPLFAQVSPGDVASIRTFLAAGYRPICSEVVFLRREWRG